MVTEYVAPRPDADHAVRDRAGHAIKRLKVSPHRIVSPRARASRTLDRSGRPSEPSIALVIPAMNEARNLELVMPRLDPAHRIILVDGRSVDDTIQVALRHRPDATVLTQTRRGKGNALACGFDAAYASGADIVVMFDCDCSADPDEIPRYVDALIAGADFVKGSRFTRAGGSADITRVRAVGNKGLNFAVNRLFGTRYTDLCYGYNAFWSDIISHFELPETTMGESHEKLWGDGFEIETILNCRIAKAGLVIAEIPSFEHLRVHGVSNLNAVSDGLRVLGTIVTERWKVPGMRGRA